MMFSQNVIKSAQVEWAAPIELFSMKIRPLRFCFVYQKENAVTKRVL